MTDTEMIQKYPELFGSPPFDHSKTSIGFGFEVGPGWLPIIEKYLPQISEIVKRNKLDDFRVVQVKEKFGSLRFYTDYSTKEIDDIIYNKMEVEAGRTCEKCGSPDGVLRMNGWMRVRCDKCEEQKGQ